MSITIRAQTLAAGLAAIVGMACGEHPSSLESQIGDDPGRVEAAVSGAVQTSFVGTGWFSNDPDHRLGLGEKFQFFSRGLAGSEGSSISAVWFGGGLPGRATYQLSPPDWRNHEGFWLFYSRELPQGRRDYFAASEGIVEITLASPERVEGSFTAVAKLYCTHDWCDDELDGTLPDVTEIQLEGSFRLAPWDPTGVVPD